MTSGTESGVAGTAGSVTDYIIHYNNPPATYSIGLGDLRVSGKEEVKIEKLDSGFKVTVGCKTIAARTLDELLAGLSLWYTDPKSAQAKYFPVPVIVQPKKKIKAKAKSDFLENRGFKGSSEGWTVGVDKSTAKGDKYAISMLTPIKARKLKGVTK